MSYKVGYARGERNGMATLVKWQLAKNSAKFARDMLDYS